MSESDLLRMGVKPGHARKLYLRLAALEQA
jgi:hypothetical protein